jgi:hypothetical protein
LFFGPKPLCCAFASCGDAPIPSGPSAGQQDSPQVLGCGAAAGCRIL